MPDEDFKSAQEFLKRMEAGEFNGRLNAELQRLSREQLTEVAELLSLRALRSEDSK